MWGGIFGIITVFILGYLERGGPNMDSYACPKHCQVTHIHKEKKDESYSEYIKRKQRNNCELYLRQGAKGQGGQGYKRQCRCSLHKRSNRGKDN